MFRKTISLITLGALMANAIGLTGCSKIVHVRAHETKDGMAVVDTNKLGRSIVAVHTKEGVVIFIRPVGIDNTSNTVAGYTPANEYVSVPLDDVIAFEVKQTSGEPLLWAAGTHLAVGIVLNLIGAAVDK